MKHLGTPAQRGGGGEVPQTPPSELGQHGHEFDGCFGQAVGGALAGTGVVPSEQTRCDEIAQPTGQDVRRDALFVLALQRPEVAAVLEHDVAQHDDAPPVAQHLYCHVDRTPRPSFVVHIHLQVLAFYNHVGLP